MRTTRTTSSAATIDMIAKLIGIPTVSRDSNLALIDFAREHLTRLGADVRLTFDDTLITVYYS